MRILCKTASMLTAAVVCMTFVGCKNSNGESSVNTDDSKSSTSSDAVYTDSVVADDEAQSIVNSTSSSEVTSEDPSLPIITKDDVTDIGHSDREDPSAPVNVETPEEPYDNSPDSTDEFELPIIPVS